MNRIRWGSCYCCLRARFGKSRLLSFKIWLRQDHIYNKQHIWSIEDIFVAQKSAKISENALYRDIKNMESQNETNVRNEDGKPSSSQNEERTANHSTCTSDGDLLFSLRSLFNEDSNTTLQHHRSANKKRQRKRKEIKKTKLNASGDDDQQQTVNPINDSDADTGYEKKVKLSHEKNVGQNEEKKHDALESCEEESRQQQAPTPRPNYFVAVRVSNPGIHSAVKEIQDSMLNHDEKSLLQQAIIPVATLHITLMVMHLEEHQVGKAVDVLQNCKSDFVKLNEKRKPLTMLFRGLGHFRNEVVFAKMNNEDEIERLKSLAAIIRGSYEASEIPNTDDRPFKPHLTILKLSRVRKKKRIKKVQPEVYSEWIDCELGQESVTEILLCSMTDKKDDDGFYHCVGSVVYDP